MVKEGRMRNETGRSGERAEPGRQEPGTPLPVHFLRLRKFTYLLAIDVAMEDPYSCYCTLGMPINPTGTNCNWVRNLFRAHLLKGKNITKSILLIHTQTVWGNDIYRTQGYEIRGMLQLYVYIYMYMYMYTLYLHLSC